MRVCRRFNFLLNFSIFVHDSFILAIVCRLFYFHFVSVPTLAVVSSTHFVVVYEIKEKAGVD